MGHARINMHLNRRQIDISMPELDVFQKELEEELHQQVSNMTGADMFEISPP